MPKKAIILGAGPAGLAVARELLQHTDIQPVILEPAAEPQGFGWLRRLRIYLSRLWALLFPRPERSLENSADIIQRIEERGGKILHHQCIYAVYTVPHAICSVHVIDSLTGELSLYTADYFYSTIPIRDLISVVQAPVPEEVRAIADQLLYRDVIKVDVELSQLAMLNQKTTAWSHLEIIGDHLYVTGDGLTVSRVQVCAHDQNSGMARIVMEYCCTIGDDFWRQDNAAIRSLAIDELEKMGLATSNDVIAMRVRRIEQAIQVRAGHYARLHTVRSYTGSFRNLFLVDRNGIPIWT